MAPTSVFDTQKAITPISTPQYPSWNAPSSASIINHAAPNTPYFTPSQDPPSGTAISPQPDNKPIPKLFQPLTIRGVTFQNRIWVSPMCQYSAHDGFHTPWHLTHLGGIIQRGPGLTIIEATAVQANGRITPEDSGLWLDAQIPALQAEVQFAHSQGQKIGIQLGHAGRKASTVAPWLSSGAIAGADVGGWPEDVVGASDLKYNDKFPQPRAMTLHEIEQFKADFVRSALRAVQAGFDVIELHGAHGYLLHNFLSPVSNKRTDAYGGSFENRTRLLVEIAEMVRAAIPKDMPLFARISATDWMTEVDGYKESEKGEEGSWTVPQSAKLAQILAEKGVDLLDVSTGGNSGLGQITTGPGYQAPMAKEIKEAVGAKMLVTAVGSITSGPQADEVLTEGEPLDAIFVGRPFQRDPALVWTWADELGIGINVASQIGWGFGGRGTKAPKK